MHFEWRFLGSGIACGPGKVANSSLYLTRHPRVTGKQGEVERSFAPCLNVLLDVVLETQTDQSGAGNGTEANGRDESYLGVSLFSDADRGLKHRHGHSFYQPTIAKVQPGCSGKGYHFRTSRSLNCALVCG